MGFVRQKLLRQFPPQTPALEPDEELAAALYFMLGSIEDLDVTVDGWALFRVVHESEDRLDVVGLMTLLPSGSVPIDLSVKVADGGLSWMARIARQDSAWLAQSDSKRSNSVYLYATGARESPPWQWDRQYEGHVHHTNS